MSNGLSVDKCSRRERLRRPHTKLQSSFVVTPRQAQTRPGESQTRLGRSAVEHRSNSLPPPDHVRLSKTKVPGSKLPQQKQKRKPRPLINRNYRLLKKVITVNYVKNASICTN